ncbi:hypothetical protein GUJ93_ZPchr0007g3735 [Zizania palustris]|uniref:Pentatricopeptide repeat-containing protein n=1 Tax=Zizania palustris TaxID=103762 RepID=A0A8J5TKE3_ZIZPA|nr:hypothetical protein GUJ93_ZPchr0007g3735 [Zizania palustris]
MDMYAKCGMMVEAREVFDNMKVRNEVSWCVLLGGYCQNGEYKKVLALFREMDQDVCHTGMVEQGRDYFNSMSKDYGIAPEIEQYNCMVDLLSRLELLEEAEDLINKVTICG